jgi:ABC-type phosphate transport system substrate-binding protein
VKKVAVLVVACLAALVSAVPAHANVALFCLNNPANGVVQGMGTAEHMLLQREIFVRVHEERCPQTTGKVQWFETSETAALAGLQGGTLEYAGMIQPLSTQEWTSRGGLHTIPLMIDGFAVTASIPCANPTNQPLRLDPLSLSLIYSGVVKSWGHRALTERNPWLATCAAAIKVSVRAGGAWSNVALKDYMSKRNPVFVPYKQRDRLGQWPPLLNVNCQGSTEDNMVACALISGSISYMRYQTAVTNGLTPVQLANQRDEYDPPANTAGETWPSGCQDAAMAMLAVPGSAVNAPQPFTASTAGPQLDWSTYSLTYPGNGYALCAAGFVITQTPIGDASQQAGLMAWKDHLRVMFDVAPQQRLREFGYAPLPSTIRTNMAGNPLFAN